MINIIIENTGGFKEWLQVEELSPNTIEQYCYYYNKYSEVHEEITQAKIDKFLLLKQNRNITARASIKRMINYFIRYKQLLNLDEETVMTISTIIIPQRKGRKKKRLIDPLSVSEIKKVEDALEREIYKIGIWVMYFGGLRISELVTIRINSFKWEVWRKSLIKKGEVYGIGDDTDFIELKVIGKGDIERSVFLPPELAVRISKYVGSNDHKYYHNSTKRLFHTIKSAEEGRPFKHKSLIRNWERVLKIAGEKANVSVDENGNPVESKRTNPHKMRHSFAGNLAKNGVSFGIIKEALGHASINSTQIYTHLSPSDVKKELKRLRNNDKKPAQKPTTHSSESLE